jgi:hypothetical protein
MQADNPAGSSRNYSNNSVQAPYMVSKPNWSMYILGIQKIFFTMNKIIQKMQVDGALSYTQMLLGIDETTILNTTMIIYKDQPVMR